MARRKKVAKGKKRAQRLGMRLKILEAIPGTRNPGQEMPILKEFLKMEGVKYTPLSVLNTLARDSLKRDFLRKLFKRYRPSGGKLHHHRHVHISAHGDGDALVLGVPEKKASLAAEDLCEYCDKHDSYLQDRLITLSACGSLLGSFAETLLDECRASVVIRPLNTVRFQESAMFFILFYFILSQRTISFECDEDTVDLRILERSDKEANEAARDIKRKDMENLTHVLIPEYIDVFQRTKAAYLNIGGTGTYRLDYWVRRGNVVIERNHLF